MAKFKITYFLNSRGQSVVEYIFLIAVLSAIGFSVFNSTKFKDLIAGKGLFESLRKGMEYSYRYGRELKTQDEYTRGVSFEYASRDHDTYYSREGKSRFFTGVEKYPQ